MLPNEARFHGLQGDILVYQRRYRAAIDKYEDAIALDDNYFDYYLGRGVAHARLDQRSLARADLERSASLLPTALAANELGRISLAEGQRTQAKQYFQAAAGAGGALGQQAQEAFLRLDVQDNPAAYVQAEAWVDERGRVLVRVSNRSPLAMRNIDIQVAALINGAVRQRSVRINSLSASSYVDQFSGLAFPEGSTWTPDMVRASVTAAIP